MQQKSFAGGEDQKPLLIKIKKADNQLRIDKVDTIWDNRGNHLILLASGNNMDCSEAYAFLNDSRLIVEAPMPFYFGYTPFRTHLVGEVVVEEYTNDDPNIGFSEIQLNPGYKYHVLTCNVLSPGLIKIVLNYKKVNYHTKSRIIN